MELSLSKIVVLDTRRPPGLPGPRGLKRLHGSYGAANLSLAEAKERLRREMRALRRRLAKINLNAADLAASHALSWSAGVSPASCGRAGETPTDQKNVVAGYILQGSELDPDPLLKRLASVGWTVVLPRVTDREQSLSFHVTGLPQTRDVFGIPSPPEQAERLRPDLMIVPVLAFDRHGGRLGQGAGCYDRTIAALRASSTVRVIGLGYAEQEVPCVPSEPHDEHLDGILTDKGFIEVLEPSA